MEHGSKNCNTEVASKSRFVSCDCGCGRSCCANCGNDLGFVLEHPNGGTRHYEIETDSAGRDTGYIIFKEPSCGVDLKKVEAALELAKNGLLWYQAEYPEAESESDYEVMQLINEALDSLKSIP